MTEEEKNIEAGGKVKKRRIELEYTPLAVFMRFIFSALFGGGVTFLIILLIMQCDLEFVIGTWAFHLLWIIPLIWGIIGIFCFEYMITLARDLIERFIWRD